ncbi:MAG: DUF2442 domain-containing protein [Ignavibacteria bacterium]|nr:DUF2442 domain-containing protein [Ignavibacteria bacterium]
MERVSVKKNITGNSRVYNVKNVNFYNNTLNINIDGKDYSFDITSLSEKLTSATIQEKSFFNISPSGYGIHWPAIDEDLSIEGLLSLKK